jgi:hypothetical protein
VTNITQDDPPEDPPRGSKRNIILGYKEVSEINLNIQAIAQKVDGLFAAIGDLKTTHGDHEARLRALETTVTSLVAAGNAGKNVWLFVYGALINLPVTIFAILQYFK